MTPTPTTDAATRPARDSIAKDQPSSSGLAWLGLAGRIAAGAGVTLGLFVLMIRLIGEPEPFVDTSGPLVYVDWETVRDDVEPPVKTNEPVKPPKPQEPPLTRVLPTFNGEGGGGVAVTHDPPPVAQQQITHFGVTDGNSIPLVKVAAVYPRRAQTRGMEGYVVYRFTITERGTVADPVLVDSMPQGVFDRAALNALMKFKYRPKIVDGRPVPVYGAQHRITFELTDA